MNQTTQDPANTPACSQEEDEDTLRGMRMLAYTIVGGLVLFNVGGVIALVGYFFGGAR